MNVTPIKTRVVAPPKDDLFEILAEALPQVKEKTVVAVTSKVVSIGEGNCVPIDSIASKDVLAEGEAERYLPRDPHATWSALHTIARKSLMSSSGIDRSNGDDYYILLPKDPMLSAERIREWVKSTFGLKDVGVVVTDSHSKPLHQGSLGQTLGYAGFEPLIDYREKQDLFGRSFQAARFNLADSLAAAAVVVMGEGSECTPVALVEECPRITFVERYEPADPFLTFFVEPEEDIFYPFFAQPGWKKKK